MTMQTQDVIEVVDTLEQAGVTVWIDGGWGVAALLVVLLADLGYTEIRTWPDSPEVFVLGAADDRRVDVHPVRFDTDGNGIQKIEGGREAAYPAQALTATGLIGGQRVRCLTAEQQTRFHAGYELKDTDAHDLGLMRERFGVQLSAEQLEVVTNRRRRRG